MALQTASQFQLSPDIGGALSRGIQSGLGIRRQQQQEQQQQQQQQFQRQQLEQRGQIAGQEQARKDQITMLQGAANAAVKAQNLPDDASRVSFLRQRVQEVAGRGGDPSDTQEVLGLFESGQTDQANALLESFVNTSIQTGLIKPLATRKLSSLQQKVEAEGLDPLTPAGQARAREITQGTRTDPSLKPSDQQVLNKANEGQLASAGFANRVSSANDVLEELEGTPGFDPTSLQTAFFEALPGGNIVLNENEQRFSQAKRDFITAVLRKESGAAIGKDEFVNEDKKFFPQVGDKPAVLKQKALGRKRAFENLKNQSKGVFDVQFKSKPKTGALSKSEQTELQQLRAELGL